MKRFLSTSFIALALVVSTAGVAPAVHAAGCGDASTLKQSCSPNTTDGGNGVCVEDENGIYCSAAAVTNGGVNPNTIADPAAEKTSKPYDAPPTTPKDSLNGIMAWIASLFAWLAGVAMVTLNYAVYFTVVTMGDYVNHLSAIGVTWRILRDIGNIILIFGFLAIGIATILNTGWYGDRNKALPMLLVAAVFLNFSLFISEAVIDTGNLFATQFYTQINGGKLPTSATLGSQGVSDKIMSQLGLTTIYGEVKDSKALYQSNPMFIGFMSIILFIILAFVLFSLAFILIARFVILLFLIIVAPIGFAGLAVPKLKGTADKWWGALFEQTITAPVLLLLLYIALAVITDASFLTSGGKPPEWLGLFKGNDAPNIAGFATAILSFLVAMGLLLAVVIISKKMSAFGGGMATSLAGKLSFGATAFVGRRTVGRVSNYAARKIGSTRFGATTYGRALVNVANKGAKASFDVRGIKAGGGLGALGVGDAGKAQEGGYRGTVERAAKSRDDYAKTLSENQKAKLDAAQYQKWDAERQAPGLANLEKLENEEKVANAKIAPLQQQLQQAMAQNDVALANQIQNQINTARAEEAQARGQINAIHIQAGPQLLAQHKTARQNITQEKQTIQDMQRQYADSLNNWWSRNVSTTGSAARNEAARQVRNRLTQTPQDRLLQQLQAALNPPPQQQQVQQPPAQPQQPQVPPGSSVRFKEGIRKLASGLGTVMSLTPVAYRYKDNLFPDTTSEYEHVGFIAEEALGVEPRLVVVGQDGQAQNFNYHEYTAVLTKAIQEQQSAIQSLREEIAILKQKPQ